MGSEGASREFLRRLTRLLEHKVWACEIESDRSPPLSHEYLGHLLTPFSHTHAQEGREKSARKMSGREDFFGGWSGKKEEDPWIVVVNDFPSN